MLGEKFWISLAICLTSLLLAYLIAIPVGIISATSKSPVVNNSLRFVSYLGLAMPNFLLALMIMLFSTVVFGDSLTGLFSKEYRDAAWSYERFQGFPCRAPGLPVFILGWSATAFAIQTVRALMSDEVGKLYVLAASARGVSGRQLLWRYPARHSLGPDHQFARLRSESNFQRIADRRADPDADRSRSAVDRSPGPLQRPATWRARSSSC